LRIDPVRGPVVQQPIPRQRGRSRQPPERHPPANEQAAGGSIERVAFGATSQRRHFKR